MGICCRTGEINQGDIKRLVLKQEVKKVSTWPRYFSINSLQVYVVSMAGLVFKGISSVFSKMMCTVMYIRTCNGAKINSSLD